MEAAARHLLPIRVLPTLRRASLAWLAATLACAGPGTPIETPLAVTIGVVDRANLEAQLAVVPRDDAERGLRLEGLLLAAGCGRDRLERLRVPGTSLPNVVCRLPGRSEREIIVGAHFDRARSGLGVADNWTGVALLPVLYRSLAAAPRHHTFRFIGFSDVMRDHAGSEYFLRGLAPAELARIRAMVNLKGLGLGSTAVWASRADPNLRLDLLSVSRSLDLPLRYVDLGRTVNQRVGFGTVLSGTLVTGHTPHSPWAARTDASTFRRRGIPTIVIHSVSRETTRLFTQPHRDRGLEPVRLEDYHESSRLIAAYLAYLDRTLLIREQIHAENGANGRG